MKSKKTLLKEYFCVEADTVLYHTKDLKKLAWIFKGTAKLINDLRKADRGRTGMRLKVDLTSGDFENPNGTIGTAFITGITAKEFESILHRAYQDSERTISFSNGSFPRDCVKHWREIDDYDAIFKARDLYFEIQLLIDLYPGLEDQLKALEDHYGICYGFEELKKDWSYEDED